MYESNPFVTKVKTFSVTDAKNSAIYNGTAT